MYAQLDFTSNRYKRVNLIGGEDVGIVPMIIEQHPNNFINLNGRDNVPLDTSEWYYDVEKDRFLKFDYYDTPESEPEPAITLEDIYDLQTMAMLENDYQMTTLKLGLGIDI